MKQLKVTGTSGGDGEIGRTGWEQGCVLERLIGMNNGHSKKNSASLKRMRI